MKHFKLQFFNHYNFFRRFVSILFIFGISSVCYAQLTQDSVIIVDDLMYSTQTQTPYSGVIQEYHADSLIKFDFIYELGVKKSTKVTHYSKKGIKKEEGFLNLENKRQGKWIVNYYPDNIPRYYTVFHNGVSDGSCRYLNKSGNEIEINITEQEYKSLIIWLIESNILSKNKKFTIINEFNEFGYHDKLFQLDKNTILLITDINMPDTILEAMYCQFKRIDTISLTDLSIDEGVVFSTLEEINELIKINKRKPHKKFLKKYGGEYCVLSKPLFSISKKTILIEISIDCYHSCEETCLYIIKNNNGVYELIDKVNCSYLVH